MDEQMIEQIARALAKAGGKDPDAPAWVEGYGNHARTFGICWRDQYRDKARAAHSVIAGKVAELSYHAEQLSTYLAQPTISEKNLASARWHNDKLRAALAPYPERRSE